MQVSKLNSRLFLSHFPTDKFKTNSVSVYIHTPLSREDVTKTALLNLVLKRGSVNFPSFKDISVELEDQYNTYFTNDICIRGNNQILFMELNCINDKFLPDGSDVFKRGINLLKDIIFNPLIINKGFKEEYVAREKENLKDLIESIINDKRSYAFQKCMEHMFEGLPGALCQYGLTEDLADITPESLYEHYLKIINNSVIDIICTGDFSTEIVKEEFSNVLSGITGTVDYPHTPLFTESRPVKDIVELMDVSQSKLVMGYKTFIDQSEDKYFDLLLYHSVLGGGTHSKLFNNVREKLSLAYYVFSSLNRFTGTLFIQSGIQHSDKQLALDEISLQMKEIENGNISDIELNASKKAIVNSFLSIKDSASAMHDFTLTQKLSNRELTLDECIDKVNSVTKEDIVNIAANIKADTIYFLTGKEEQ